jgi:hypothetical protein
MSVVDEYIERLENTHHQHLTYHIHHLLMTYEGITCKIRFRVPFYDGKKWICYINPIKKNGVEICFIKGFKLSPKPQLIAGKRTMVKGISVYEINEEVLSLIAEVFEEAMLLDAKNNV